MSDYLKGDLKIFKLLNVKMVSKPILAAMNKMFDASEHWAGDDVTKGLPLVRKDVVHESDFFGVVDRATTKLRKDGKKPLWFDMSLSGFEELFIFYGSEKSILKAIAARMEKSKEV